MIISLTFRFPLFLLMLLGCGFVSASDVEDNAHKPESGLDRRQRAVQQGAKNEAYISQCLKANDVSKALDSARETHALLTRELGADHGMAVGFGRITLELSLVSNFSQVEQAVYCDCFKVRRDIEKSISGVFDAERASQQLEGRITLLKQSLGNESISYISTLLVLATVDAMQQRNESMRDRFAEALPLVEKTLGKQSSQYARALEGLGLAKLNLGDFAEAERLFRDCLPIRERIWGKDSVEYVTTLLNLSLAQLRQGKLVEAEESAHQTLKACAAHRDDRSTFYGGCIRQLGEVHLAKGNTAEADACFEKAIAVFEVSNRYSLVLAKLYGLRATTLRNLGRTVEEATVKAKAEAILSLSRNGSKTR